MLFGEGGVAHSKMWVGVLVDRHLVQAELGWVGANGVARVYEGLAGG